MTWDREGRSLDDSQVEVTEAEPQFLIIFSAAYPWFGVFPELNASCVNSPGPQRLLGSRELSNAWL